MSNCLISYNNYVQLNNTTLSSNGSEVSGLGIARLKDMQIRRRWRTPTGVVAPTFDIDFGSAMPVGVMALVQPDDAGGLSADNVPQGFLASSDTVTYKLSAVSVGANEVLDTGAIASQMKAGFGSTFYYNAAQSSARYWRGIPNAASLSGGVNYLDIGAVWAGATYVPLRNMQYGYNWAFLDTSTINNVVSSGLDFVKYGPRRRQIVFGFDSIDSTSVDTISALTRLVGSSRQVLFIPDYTDRTSEFAQPIIGRLIDNNPINLPSFNTFTKSFTLLQSL